LSCLFGLVLVFQFGPVVFFSSVPYFFSRPGPSEFELEPDRPCKSLTTCNAGNILSLNLLNVEFLIVTFNCCRVRPLAAQSLLPKMAEIHLAPSSRIQQSQSSAIYATESSRIYLLLTGTCGFMEDTLRR